MKKRIMMELKMEMEKAVKLERTMRKVTRKMEMVMSRVITVRVVMELKSLNSLTKIEGPSIGQISKNSNV